MKKALLVTLFGCLCITACGQRGSLYFPPDETVEEQTEQSTTTASIQASAAESVTVSVEQIN